MNKYIKISFNLVVLNKLRRKSKLKNRKKQKQPDNSIETEEILLFCSFSNKYLKIDNINDCSYYIQKIFKLN